MHENNGIDPELRIGGKYMQGALDLIRSESIQQRRPSLPYLEQNSGKFLKLSFDFVSIQKTHIFAPPTKDR